MDPHLRRIGVGNQNERLNSNRLMVCSAMLVLIVTAISLINSSYYSMDF